MAELTYEEKLQLDNSIEHLRVVQGNLRIASEELSMVLSLVNSANQDLVRITQQKEKIQNENTKFLEDVSQIKSSQDRIEISLNEKESKIDNREKELEERVSHTTKKLKDINRNIILSESKYGKFIESKEEEIKTLENKIISLKEEDGTYQEKIRLQSEVTTKKENEITKLNEEIEDIGKKLNKFQDESFKEMKETILLIQKEKDKIKNPLELVKREQEKLEVLKKDLSVIRLRLSNQYRAQNPDKQLPIELQDKK